MEEEGVWELERVLKPIKLSQLCFLDDGDVRRATSPVTMCVRGSGGEVRGKMRGPQREKKSILSRRIAIEKSATWVVPGMPEH